MATTGSSRRARASGRRAGRRRRNLRHAAEAVRRADAARALAAGVVQWCWCGWLGRRAAAAARGALAARAANAPSPPLAFSGWLAAAESMRTAGPALNFSFIERYCGHTPRDVIGDYQCVVVPAGPPIPAPVGPASAEAASPPTSRVSVSPEAPWDGGGSIDEEVVLLGAVALVETAVMHSVVHGQVDVKASWAPGPPARRGAAAAAAGLGARREQPWHVLAPCPAAGARGVRTGSRALPARGRDDAAGRGGAGQAAADQRGRRGPAGGAAAALPLRMLFLPRLYTVRAAHYVAAGTGAMLHQIFSLGWASRVSDLAAPAAAAGSQPSGPPDPEAEEPDAPPEGPGAAPRRWLPRGAERTWDAGPPPARAPGRRPRRVLPELRGGPAGLLRRRRRRGELLLRGRGGGLRRRGGPGRRGHAGALPAAARGG
ncbi:unnamed protein product, partial [Prorocentrum cordatum]